MTNFPLFRDFFRALWSEKPFPWQERLVDEVLQNGWPDLLNLPTGTGKTSALDVALYCLAVAPERLPRRTVLVVDRRIIVDQGAERARRIATMLRTTSDGPLKVVADKLRSIWNGDSDEEPFAVAVMRGGMPRDNDWARRPDQPVLGVSTIDQVGSRLLFRGYGVSSRSASIHAGLLGNDTLILLDEVHLAVPFTQTLEAIQSRFRVQVPGLPARFFVTRMSATPSRTDSSWRTFPLDEADLRDPELNRRLAAKKVASLSLVKVSGDDESKKRAVLAQRAVAEATDLQNHGARIVGIVVNRVDTARLVYRSLLNRDGAQDGSVLLITGRMRGIERDNLVRDVLLKRAGPRARTDADKPLFVVATQCIEAGADLDLDALVTECASLDALRQRMGRLDRRGTLGSSRAVILGRTDAVSARSEDPIYGSALAATWDWLSEVAQDSMVDFGSRAIDQLLSKAAPDQLTSLLAPSENAPVLLPAHLDAWSQTCPASDFEPEVAHWLHGDSKPSADVQIVWRSEVELPDERGDGLLDDVRAKLSLRRPSSLESVTIPLAVARQWLANEPSGAIADTARGLAEEEPAKSRSKGTSGALVALRWTGEQSEYVTVGEIRPGDVLVVPTNVGGISAGSFDPDAHEPVTDLGDVVQLRGRGIASLLLTEGGLKPWGLVPGSDMPRVVADESLQETRTRLCDWVATLPTTPAPGCVCTEEEWRRICQSFATASARRVKIAVQGETIMATAIAPRGSLPPEIDEAITEDDASSFRQVEVSLLAHSSDVRSVVSGFAHSLGLNSSLVDDLALAAWLHDIGKADRRFQRWLVGGSSIRETFMKEPLAKSALPPTSLWERDLARERAGYPRGYRHELLSLAMIEDCSASLEQAHDRDLVMHLVASHHGWCRPFPPPLEDDSPDRVSYNHGGVEYATQLAHRKARLDSGVADRFWSLSSKYGWWGLAWLEAILRLADHRASEQESDERSCR